MGNKKNSCESLYCSICLIVVVWNRTCHISEDCWYHDQVTALSDLTSTTNIIQLCQHHDKLMSQGYRNTMINFIASINTTSNIACHMNTLHISHSYLNTNSTTIMVVCECHDQTHRIMGITPKTMS